jgi:hypothetical protein
MQADAAIFRMSVPEVLFFGAAELTFVLAVAWFGARSRQEDFSFGRVVLITLLCLSTSLPFAWLAYRLWPWDFQSWLVKCDILSAVFTPLFAALILGIIRKRKLTKR